jgi:hypothetical protein
MSARIEGITVDIGDWVGFKSDIEQSGKIVAIKQTYAGTSLTLESEHGFHGDYIGGDTITTVLARDCWIDG